MVCPIPQGDHKKRDAQKKRSSNKVRGDSPEAWSLWWERFVKEIRREPGVKERGSYGW